MRILRRIVGVRRTEQSAGIINLTSQSNEKLGYIFRLYSSFISYQADIRNPLCYLDP